MFALQADGQGFNSQTSKAYNLALGQSMLGKFFARLKNNGIHLA